MTAFNLQKSQELMNAEIDSYKTWQDALQKSHTDQSAQHRDHCKKVYKQWMSARKENDEYSKKVMSPLLKF